MIEMTNLDRPGDEFDSYIKNMKATIALMDEKRKAYKTVDKYTLAPFTIGVFAFIAFSTAPLTYQFYFNPYRRDSSIKEEYTLTERLEKVKTAKKTLAAAATEEFKSEELDNLEASLESQLKEVEQNHYLQEFRSLNKDFGYASNLVALTGLTIGAAATCGIVISGNVIRRKFKRKQREI